MDTLTHGLSGALLARAFKTLHVKPRSFLVVGFLAGIFPDFDFVFNAVSQTAYLLNHRGITHSVFLMPLWGFVISLFCAWMFKNKIFFQKNWVDETVSMQELIKELWLLATGAILLHIIGDVVTQFGTMLLTPFSRQRFETGSVFIIDLKFSGILLGGLLLSYLPRYRRVIACLSLVVWGAYIFSTHQDKLKAQEIAKNYLQSQNITVSGIYSSPRPLNNWSIYAYDKDFYYTTDFSLDREKTIFTDYRNQNFIQLISNSYPSYTQAHWEKLPKWGRTQEEQTLAHQIWNEDLFTNYRWFYAMPVFDFMTQHNNKTCGYFRDLRFLGVGREPGTPFVYGICYEGKNRSLVHFRNKEEVVINAVKGVKTLKGG